MRLGRKLLLIAPTIVLLFVAAGTVYAAVQLSVLGSVSDTWKQRSDFIGSVERGDKPLDRQQAVRLLRFALDVEARRTGGIQAARDLLILLAAVSVVACATLAVGIRAVPRHYWPRFTKGPAHDQ